MGQDDVLEVMSLIPVNLIDAHTKNEILIYRPVPGYIRADYFEGVSLLQGYVPQDHQITIDSYCRSQLQFYYQNSKDLLPDYLTELIEASKYRYSNYGPSLNGYAKQFLDLVNNRIDRIDSELIKILIEIGQYRSDDQENSYQGEITDSIIKSVVSNNYQYFAY